MVKRTPPSHEDQGPETCFSWSLRSGAKSLVTGYPSGTPGKPTDLENTGTIEFSTTFGMGCLWFVINDLFYLVSESMEMCHARKAQATWFFSAWEHCPAAKAARAGYQNFVPGCSRFLCHQLYQHRHRPQTESARNKRKKTCTGMHQHEKKTACTSTSCLSVHANKDAKTYQRAVHSSLVAVAVRKLFKSLRYTNIVGWRNPDHFK